MTNTASFERTQPHLLESRGDPVTVGDQDIAALIDAAKQSPSGRARILLHTGAEDSLHEMVIALPKTSCDHPHINYKSGKSFMALSGRFAVMRFSEDGRAIETYVLSAGPWSGKRMVRLRAAAWHTIIPLDGDTVFLETILGPFTGNYFAEWFPAESCPKERHAFADRLRQIARKEAGLIDEESACS